MEKTLKERIANEFAAHHDHSDLIDSLVLLVTRLQMEMLSRIELDFHDSVKSELRRIRKERLTAERNE